MPRPPPSSRSLTLRPWASILLSWALGHLLGFAARNSPTTRAKTGRTAHVLQHRGARAEKSPPQPQRIARFWCTQLRLRLPLWTPEAVNWVIRSCTARLQFIVQWADPGVRWKKAPKAIRAMRGKPPQTVPFKGISTVLWVHQELPQSTVSQAFPSNKSYESKAGCNRTPATVLWVPLIQEPLNVPFLNGLFCRQFSGGKKAHHGICWEPVDLVVADPVRQDNDKRNNIQ